VKAMGATSIGRGDWVITSLSGEGGFGTDCQDGP
jgi:hypothetical protein